MMDKKTWLFALAGVPLLSLFAAVALADVSELPQDSGNGIAPVPGNIKNRNQCPFGTTFFKNAFPSLTNGNPGGSSTINFMVDGETVPMTVTWDSNNSFGFELGGGVAYKVGVTVDTNNFIYDYTSALTNGRADTQMNYFGENVSADDVNHLDLCLATVDSEDPVVTITAPADGDDVSGIVSIIATVTDNEGLDSVNVTVDGAPPNDGQTIAVDGPSISGNVYTWSFDASMLDAGDYVITVEATDTSILANTVTVSITVTVVRSLKDCLEGEDLVPPGEESEGGCNLTGYLQLEYPNAAGQLGNLPVAQEAIPAKLAAQNATCGDSGAFPLIAKDPRVDGLGNVIANASQDLSELFDIAGHYAQFHPNEPLPQVILRADTVGSPCLALLHQDAPEFAELTAALPNGGVYTVTQFPENVPGMYDSLPRITAPLNYCDPALPCYQPDLQFVEQAALQTDDLLLLVEREASPFTSDVFNASRTKGFKGTFFPLNTREVCLFLDPALDPSDGTPYFEAVLQCKTDLAVEYFDSLEQALNEAEPNLISPSLNSLRTDLNKARSMVKVGRWNKARRDLTDLFNQVTSGTWIVDFRNDPGNLIMRIENLFFRIDQLELAEDNLP